MRGHMNLLARRSSIHRNRPQKEEGISFDALCTGCRTIGLLDEKLVPLTSTYYSALHPMQQHPTLHVTSALLKGCTSNDTRVQYRPNGCHIIVSHSHVPVNDKVCLAHAQAWGYILVHIFDKKNLVSLPSIMMHERLDEVNFVWIQLSCWVKAWSVYRGGGEESDILSRAKSLP
mmetsp:Transcript_15380/g.36925  ORF Transcript_15380/g.36925 Transcript_15380/m.36925 type:complete len:174 (-) Transcript_15380:300-821(-)